MPWSTPTLKDVRGLVRDNIRGTLPGADASIPNSVLRVLGDAQGGLKKMQKEIEGTKFSIKGSATKGDTATLKVLRQKGDESDTGEIAFVRENGEWKMLPPQ